MIFVETGWRHMKSVHKKNLFHAIRGFTLIELMIVIAIVGVLAAVAVPRYNQYVIRAGMAEALSLTNEAKTKLIEYYTLKSKFPPADSNFSKRNHMIGMGDHDSYNTEIINGFWWGRGGIQGKDDTSVHIAVRFADGLDLGITNSAARPYLISTLEVLDGQFELICGNTTSRNPSTVLHKNLPASCQN